MPSEGGVGFGLTMFEAALCIAPSGLIMLLLSPFSGWFERTFGARRLMLIGTAFIALTYVFLLVFADAVWHIVVANALIGAGIAFTFAAMPMIIMRSVPASETGQSNALNALFRSVGTSTASAVMGAVLAAMSTAAGPTREAFVMCFALTLGAACIAVVLALMIPRSPRASGDAALGGPITGPTGPVHG
jgi:MFS family permease